MSGTIKKTSIKKFVGDGVCCLAIVVLGLALGLPRYRNGIDLSDEGFLAYGAMRVLEGEMPNRDFVSLQPPLSFYSLALVYKLFGTSLLTLRGFGLCIYVLIPVLVYAMSRHLTGRLTSLAAAVPASLIGMPVWLIAPFASWQGIIATLTAALFIMRAAATDRRLWAFAAGVTSSLAILLRHDQGFYLLVAILIYALALKFAQSDTLTKPHSGRMLVFWVLGGAVVMLPLGVYWLACGAIGDMFEQLVVFPLTKYAKTSSLPMPVFSSDQPFQENVLIGLFYLPPIVAGLTALLLVTRLVRRRFYVKDAFVAFITAFTLLFYLQVLTRSDIYHLVDTLTPFFVLCGFWLGAASKTVGNEIWKVYGHKRDIRSLSFAAEALVLFVAGTIGAFFLYHTKTVFLRPSSQQARVISLERAGVRIEPLYASSIEDVTRMIQTYAEPERSILCLPYQPMYYFLSARHNPTHWNYLWPGDQSIEDHLELIRQARNDPPAVVIIIGKKDLQKYAPAITDYIDAEYRVTHKIGGALVQLPLGQK